MSFLEHLTHRIYMHHRQIIMMYYIMYFAISFRKEYFIVAFDVSCFPFTVFFFHHNATYSERNLWFENTVTRDQAQKGWNSHAKHIMWHNGIIERLFSPCAVLVAQWNIFKRIVKCGYMDCSMLHCLRAGIIRLKCVGNMTRTHSYTWFLVFIITIRMVTGNSSALHYSTYTMNIVHIF